MGSSDRNCFEVVIIGSGFGGSVMAYRLARAGLKVCVLERGKAYAPGEFPRSPRAVADNVWDRSRGLKGLFDFWSFDSMEAVVASGLGGGSLIYANVMLRMPDEWFVIDEPNGSTRPWPVGPRQLDRHYAAVEAMLGATPYPYAASTPKTKAFLRATDTVGLERVKPLNLAVAFTADGNTRPGLPLHRKNLHHAPRSTCVGCGECDAGCNYGSKNTTDLTYLSKAKAAGAEIRTRAEALWIHPMGDEGYEVEYLRHYKDFDGKPLTESELPKRRVRARALVLSAGSLATTHLLLRNRPNLPGLSDQLGTRFSGNGDALAFVVDADKVLDPSDGPVITASAKSLDWREGGDGRGFFLQDGGYPQFFNWVRQTVPPLGTTGRLARFAAGQVLAHVRRDPRSEVSGELRRVLGTQRTAHSLVLLGIGRSRADGVMTLRDGYLAIDWSMRNSEAYYRRVREAMEAYADAVGGRFSDNLLSRVHRVVAAHPLGGCPMGEGPDDGVVDRHGRVHGYKRLVIADGSVLPSAAGSNPSLTIAALADRFADRLIDDVKKDRKKGLTCRSAH